MQKKKFIIFEIKFVMGRIFISKLSTEEKSKKNNFTSEYFVLVVSTINSKMSVFEKNSNFLYSKKSN